MIESDLYYIIGISAVGIASIIYLLFGPNPNQSKCKQNAPINGLINVKNNCFTNSILQAIANSESMVTWLTMANGLIESKGKLIDRMYHLINGINQKALGSLSPNEVIASLEDYDYGFLFSGGQQDAHELLNAITTTLDDEFRFYSTQNLLNNMLEDKNIKHEYSLKQSINNVAIIFFNRNRKATPPLPSRGILVNQLKCHHCHYKYPLHLEVFNVISLSLPTMLNPLSRMIITLEDCLNKFISKEIIEDFNCESCSQRSKFDKKIEFIRLPRLLCFHIQRVIWMGNMTDSQLRKRLERVIFPEVLIMDPFTFNFKSFNHCEKKNPTNTSSTEKVETINEQSSRYRYQIKSIIVHFGDDSSGHYVCYRHLYDRVKQKYKWYAVSDRFVNEIDSNLVFTCSAYMIFYERTSLD